MPVPSPTLRITLNLRRRDYRSFTGAARLLRRIMSRGAPDARTLMAHNLQNRDATGLADDYLDSIRWPHEAGRVVSLRRPAQPRTAEKPVRPPAEVAR